MRQFLIVKKRVNAGNCIKVLELYCIYNIQNKTRPGKNIKIIIRTLHQQYELA